ncbi:acetylornithine deacetylase [Fictibacillus phosphorivorans]|uniref:Acetylornithine deacetylase n=1 Tax=Fictibacillus phosphorivorans TaxID=1221500 RepID=A0A165NH02_9BACL|nr:peptidase [Fictibacillus phosphorivorans]KZE66027.1 acetylornithine deacetylase [Fictibacillus phosphorivorans]
MLVKEKLSNWLINERDKAVEFLQKTVQEASTTGNETGVQHLIAQKLKEIGLEVDMWYPIGEELAKHPNFCASRTDFSTSPNVVGIWRGTGNGRSLVLNGHIDVVPEGDLTQWEEHPYSGKVIDGKLYGRGSTDMKGGNLSLLLAIQALKETGAELKGDLFFHSVIEEESGGAGTLAAVLRGYKADAAIIPEPTNMKIFPAQQGSMWFRLTIKGKAAHGGTRYEGVSAIEKAGVVLSAIKDLETVRNKRITDPLYKDIPIPVPINVGKIGGGNWPSSVPDSVELEGRIGVAPNETLEDVKAELESYLSNLSDSWLKDNPITIEWFGAQWLPGLIETDHPLMNILRKNFEGVTGNEPIIEASPWGTDGGLLSQVGDTPSIVFGPGVTAVAHYPNEYIEITKIIETAEIIALTIYDWCGGENL